MNQVAKTIDIYQHINSNYYGGGARKINLDTRVIYFYWKNKRVNHPPYGVAVNYLLINTTQTSK